LRFYLGGFVALCETGFFAINQRRKRMRIFAISMLLTLCAGSMALANSAYVCTHGDAERRIEVVYLEAGKVPCEVRYTRNGSTEVLWNAQAEEGYCEARAAEFVEKQRGWGWECVESGADMSEAPEADMPEEQNPE
jgi:hypothetical protein